MMLIGKLSNTLQNTANTAKSINNYLDNSNLTLRTMLTLTIAL